MLAWNSNIKFFKVKLVVSERHISVYTILGSMPQITKIHIESLVKLKTKNLEVIALGSRDKKNDV